MTEFSSITEFRDFSTEAPCTGAFDCNPMLVYAIAIPAAAVIMSVIIVSLFYIAFKLRGKGRIR